jgi:hypothetical protein
LSPNSSPNRNLTREDIDYLSPDYHRILGEIELREIFGSPPPSPPPSPTGNDTDLHEKIIVFDPVYGDDQSASTFFEDQEFYNPFIISDPSTGKFSGNAVNFPASSEAGNEYIECKDDAPSSWMGYAYYKFVKPNGRIFVKMNLSGSVIMVEKPSWYDECKINKVVPGTKFFKLVKSDKVIKYVSTVLADPNVRDFNAWGAEHCNQLTPISTYKLENMTSEELEASLKGLGQKRKTDNSESSSSSNGKRNRFGGKSKKRKTKRLRKSLRKRRR